jgi:glycine/D-amino acid oxidase-like deaminating enzyme
MKALDYIIVGQGIAGTALAHTLLQRGKSLVVIDQSLPNTPSKVAAGLFNPITGRNMVKSWLADHFFPFLHQFYPDLERTLDASFFRPCPIYIPFDSIEKQNTWVAKSIASERAGFIGKFHSKLYASKIAQHFGGMEIIHAGSVHTPTLLQAFAHHLQKLGMREEAYLDPSTIELSPEGVRWKGVAAKRIIFCDGPANALNPLFKGLDYRPAKGEILDIRIPDAQFEHIISRGTWIVPMGGDLYRAGANYERTTDPTPSAHGKNQVTEGLGNLLSIPYEVVGHQAGIRPATHDRRPYIGVHPQHSALVLFGGMGSKGISMAPYLAQMLVQHLEENAPISADAHLGRCRLL